MVYYGQRMLHSHTASGQRLRVSKNKPERVIRGKNGEVVIAQWVPGCLVHGKTRVGGMEEASDIVRPAAERA